MTRRNDSQQTTNAIIAQKIETLQKTITDGFTGVYQRQDTTNGKVLKAGEDIATLQKADMDIRAVFRYNRIIWYMLTVSVSVIITLASYILFNK